MLRCDRGGGVPQGYVNSLNNTFVQAVATGIGVDVSSGDNGDETTTFGAPAVDFYADSPFVTAVGGTSASVVPSGATPTALYAATDDPRSALNQDGWKRDFEVGWHTGRDVLSGGSLTGSGTSFAYDGTLAGALPGSFFGGGGGGVSKVSAEPSSQQTSIGAFSGRAVTASAPWRTRTPGSWSVRPSSSAPAHRSTASTSSAARPSRRR